MNYRSNIARREKIDDIVLPRFSIDLHFSEAGNVREGGAVARVVVLCRSYQALARQSCNRSFCQWVHIIWRFVAVVNATELNCISGRLCQGDPSAAFAKNSLIGNFILLGSAAKFSCCNLLKLLLSIHCRCMCSPRHGVCGLAAAGNASKRKIFPGIAPYDLAFVPGHA